MINKCEKLNITQGTDIQLVVEMRREGKPFPVELSDGVQVNMVSSRGVRKSMSFRVGDGRVAIPLMAEDFAIGVYGVEIFGVLNDAKWRTFGASVVEYTYETVIGETRVITTGDTYDIVLEVGPMSDIIPTFFSQLTNDIFAVTDANYVHTDNNFEDAYKQFFELGLVTLLEDGVLPEASEDTMNHIYLVPNEEAGEDVCTAYVTVKKEVVEEEEETPENPENPDGETPDDTPDEGGDEGGGDEPQPEPEPVTVYEWKQFGGGGGTGGGTIQLVKVDGVALPIDEEDKSVNIDLSGKVDKEEGKGLSTNDYTNEEKTKLAGLQNYDDTAVRELIATETTRATTAEGNLDTTKANKSEMTVVAGTGANADKTTITLKTGTSATVLTQHQDISGKEDKVSVVNIVSGTPSVNAQVGKHYIFDKVEGRPLNTFTLNLPAITSTDIVQNILFSFHTASNPSLTIAPPAGVDVVYMKGYSIQPAEDYELNIMWNGLKWVVAYGFID